MARLERWLWALWSRVCQWARQPKNSTPPCRASRPILSGPAIWAPPPKYPPKPSEPGLTRPGLTRQCPVSSHGKFRPAIRPGCRRSPRAKSLLVLRPGCRRFPPRHCNQHLRPPWGPSRHNNGRRRVTARPWVWWAHNAPITLSLTRRQPHKTRHQTHQRTQHLPLWAPLRIRYFPNANRLRITRLHCKNAPIRATTHQPQKTVWLCLSWGRRTICYRGAWICGAIISRRGSLRNARFFTHNFHFSNLAFHRMECHTDRVP